MMITLHYIFFSVAVFTQVTIVDSDIFNFTIHIMCVFDIFAQTDLHGCLWLMYAWQLSVSSFLITLSPSFF